MKKFEARNLGMKLQLSKRILKKLMKSIKLKKAYSLIELSIVILIISILITGALSVSIGSANNAKAKVTNDRIQQIYRALGNFLVANKRLPCPAALTKVKTVNTDYGNEVGFGSGCSGTGVIQSGSSANLVYGMVPVRALGLPNDLAEDGYESKLAYIIDKNFTNVLADAVPNYSNLNFATATSTGIMTVNEKPSGITQTVTTDALVVLISYGANKAGAYNANASTVNARSTPADADEQSNDASTSGTFFDNTIVASSSNSDTFDDIVFYKRRNDFVEDFKVMFLIPCDGRVTATQTANFTSSNNAYYGQIVTNPACTSPTVQTRKCEAYGTWMNVANSCI